MKDLQAVILAAVLLSPVALGAGEKEAVSPLTDEHWNAARTLSFKTPAGWKVTSTPGNLELTEARGDGLIFRILRRPGELGLDSLHVECMLVRLAPPMETHPHVDYEYDTPIEGEKKWRQRNLTLVNENESVCVVTYAPVPVWKKNKAARKLLTSIVESLKWP